MKVEFNNLYTHFIFTTLMRESLIREENRIRIEKYMTGIVNNHASRMYAIHANPEHVHFLVSRDPGISEQKLANIVADSSENFINENILTRGHFAWQQSCSAFTVSKSDIDRVCKYILNQSQHHKVVSFADEYALFIKHYQKTIRGK